MIDPKVIAEVRDRFGNPERIARAKAEREALEQQGRSAWAWLHAEAKQNALSLERLKVEFWPMIPKGYGVIVQRRRPGF